MKKMTGVRAILLLSCMAIVFSLASCDTPMDKQEIRYTVWRGRLPYKEFEKVFQGTLIPGIPHYNDCNTLSRQSSRLLHRYCLWRSGIFFALMISEKSTCFRIFKTIFRKTLKFAAALSFRTRQ